ncbi:hypothetical protein RJ639_001345 [Escallonia herrerae]|uniref:Uncharacterized protein n=1 Tax=Escallonia herrerae TaxID=1293975 RepID=A0AA89BH70_9ASTE|nr:hypothetical protein RJ639_001345 [Escallonia herrerae]
MASLEEKANVTELRKDAHKSHRVLEGKKKKRQVALPYWAGPDQPSPGVSWTESEQAEVVGLQILEPVQKVKNYEILRPALEPRTEAGFPFARMSPKPKREIDDQMEKEY